MTGQEARLEANRNGGGVHGPAFKPLQTWEGLRKKSQGFKPDPGNLAVRDYRGASGNVSHGGTVNPSCDRKSRNGNPSPTAGRARFLSQWRGTRGMGGRKKTTPTRSGAKSDKGRDAEG